LKRCLHKTLLIADKQWHYLISICKGKQPQVQVSWTHSRLQQKNSKLQKWKTCKFAA